MTHSIISWRALHKGSPTELVNKDCIRIQFDPIQLPVFLYTDIPSVTYWDSVKKKQKQVALAIPKHDSNLIVPVSWKINYAGELNDKWHVFYNVSMTKLHGFIKRNKSKASKAIPEFMFISGK